MKKQQKQLLLLLLLFLLLAAGFFGLRAYNKVQSSKPQETTGETVISVSKDDIVRFSYDYEGSSYSFEKEGDTWYYSEDRSLKLNQQKVGNLLLSVEEIVAEETIPDVTDMSQFGLKEPSRTISFETTDASYVLYVGDYNTMTSLYYICMPSDTTVYAVKELTVNGFNSTLEDLVEEEDSAGTEKNSEAEIDVSLGDSNGDSNGNSN